MWKLRLPIPEQALFHIEHGRHLFDGVINLQIFSTCFTHIVALNGLTVAKVRIFPNIPLEKHEIWEFFRIFAS
jgi:hypothetical protein